MGPGETKRSAATGGRPRAALSIGLVVLLGLLVLPALPAASAEDEPEAPAEPATAAAEAAPTLDESKYDARNGADILETCAACHGRDGEGGGDGTYPRLAGLPPEYIARQVRSFKKKERINLPMFPYATERELPEDDVRDIALYLSKIELARNMPELPPDTPAFQRLQIARRVLNVPRVPGDVEKGARTYKKSCRRCHGTDGWGRGTTPPLAGQHSDYLRRQIGLFLAGDRKNDDMLEVIQPLSPSDIEDLLAFLSSRDD